MEKQKTIIMKLIPWLKDIVVIISIIASGIYFIATRPSREEMETKDAKIEARTIEQYKAMNNLLDILIQDRLNQK